MYIKRNGKRNNDIGKNIERHRTEIQNSGKEKN